MRVLFVALLAWMAFCAGYAWRDEDAYRDCRRQWKTLTEAPAVWEACQKQFGFAYRFAEQP